MDKTESRFPKLPELPVWYCCKTTYHNNGKIEAEIMRDEDTKQLIAISDEKKPLDGVFETATATIYFIYGEYEECVKHVRMAAGM